MPSGKEQSRLLCLGVSEKRARMAYTAGMYVHFLSSQNATALAAATFRESTPCDMGIFTV